MIIALGAIFDSEGLVLSDVMMIAFFAQLLTLVIGILCITNEFRHGTITPTLLVSPDRIRLVLAKVVASLLVGLVLGLAACAIIAAVVAVAGGETDDALELIAGGAILAGLYAVLGVGLGAIIRNQVGAIIGALVYILLLEGLIGLVPGSTTCCRSTASAGRHRRCAGPSRATRAPSSSRNSRAGCCSARYIAAFADRRDRGDAAPRRHA